jgi:membrane-bound lytic murein transglycosylase A
MVLTEISYKDIGSWEKDRHAAAMDAYIKSCDKLLNNDPENPTSKLTPVGGSSIDWQVPCMEATQKAHYTDAEAKQFFEKWFKPYKVSDENQNIHGTLTGYYEIEIQGSRIKHGKYKYPVYMRPKDIDHLKGTTYLAHAAINDGALAGKNLEIAWVDNLARLYFMQIQGSGVIHLAEGGELRVGFDGSNGYRFQGINDALRAENYRQKSNRGTIIDWLHANPERCERIVESDPSYVFFKEVNAPSALGGQGIPLKTERSLAVDAGLYPYGTPIWVDAELPYSPAYRSGKYARLMIAQDAGGVIKGPTRGDVFFGRGKKAEQVANKFKTKGTFLALFPKTIQVPRIYTASN